MKFAKFLKTPFLQDTEVSEAVMKNFAKLTLVPKSFLKMVANF